MNFAAGRRDFKGRDSEKVEWSVERSLLDALALGFQCFVLATGRPFTCLQWEALERARVDSEEKGRLLHQQ